MGKQTNNSTDSDKDAIEFLKNDYSEIFAQAKYYDEQIIDIFKYLLTSYSAIVTIIIGLYKFPFENKIEQPASFIQALSPAFIAGLTIAFFFGISMFYLIVRNRVYFVRCMRYINELRRTFLSYKPLNFENKCKMYTKSDKPLYFNTFSTQSLFLYIVSFLNSFILTIVFYIMKIHITCIVLLSLIIFIIQLGWTDPLKL